MNTTRRAGHAATRLRDLPWAPAVLVWLAGVAMSAITPLGEFEFALAGYPSLGTETLHFHAFIYQALVFPGVMMGAMLLYFRRHAFTFCMLYLAACIGAAMYVSLAIGVHPQSATFWVGSVLPIVLLGLAAVLSRRTGTSIQRKPT